jgi:hypothetical protein
MSAPGIKLSPPRSAGLTTRVRFFFDWDEALREVRVAPSIDSER